MLFLKNIVVLCFLFFCVTLTSQEYVLSNKTQFQLVSVKDGLPSNSANSIIQDRNGYIWVGSFGGLSRYDGYEFKTYQQDKENPNSLINNYILALYEDSEGYIWIGTMLNGLQRFDPKTETFITYPTDQLGGIDPYINKIVKDTMGHVWVGTLNGLFRMTSPKGTFEVDDVLVEHFPAIAYSDTLLTTLSTALYTEALVAGIQEVGSKQQRQKKFILNKKTQLVVVGTGEYGGIKKGMLDYGWISNDKGKDLWKMRYQNTHTATSLNKRGDHPFNRRTIQIIELDAGEYQLNYVSDEKHHYEQWDLASIPAPYSRKNGKLPDFSKLWGIQIYAFDTDTLNWIQKQLELRTANQLVSGSSVNDLYIDEQQQLWVATSGGLDKIDISNNTIDIHHLHNNDKRELAVPLDFVSTIYEKNNGDLWFCGHQFNCDTQKYEGVIESLSSTGNGQTVSQVLYAPELTDDIKIIEDANLSIWLTAGFSGFYQLASKEQIPTTYQLIEYPFVTENASTLFLDKSNVLWVGVWQEGAYKLNPSAEPFKFISLPAKDNFHVTSFVEDIDGSVFIGTNSQGVFKWNRVNNQIEPIATNLKIDERVLNLVIDKQRRLWIGAHLSGLYVYSLKTQQYISNFPSTQGQVVQGNVMSMKADKAGNVWISTDTGIYCYFTDVDKLVRYEQLSNLVVDGAYAMLIDEQQKELLICDQLKGLHVVDLKNHNPTTIAPKVQTYFKDNTLFSISKDRSTGNFWISTYKGLQLIDKKTKAIIPFKDASQFNKVKIYTILPDSLGNIWLGTSSGIGKYNTNSGHFNIFKEQSGIYLNEDRAGPSILTSWGEILVGGKNRFYHFYPSKANINTIPPEVQIIKLVSNSSVEQDSSLVIINPTKLVTLKSNQNTIEINYVGLHFDKSTENEYAYRMLGLNDNWIFVGKERIARFNSLPAGSYTFQVKASNGDGVWNEVGVKLPLKVLPPWWKTTWAYLLYALLTFGALFAIYINQIRRIKLRNQLAYEQKEAERLVELDRLKTNFFSNITHEFRTPLTLIIEPARQLVKKWKTDEDKATLKLIEKNSQHLLELVNQLLDLSKLEDEKMAVELHRGQLRDTTQPIIDSFKQLAKRQSINFTFEQSTTLPEFYFDKNKIEKILYNLLSNAFKFTEKGSVHLEISQIEAVPQLLIRVSDTGVGISEKQLPYIFDRFYQADNTITRRVAGTGIGLALTKELIHLMEGTIAVTSELNKGTEFLVTLPLLLEVDHPSMRSTVVNTSKETFTTRSTIGLEPKKVTSPTNAIITTTDKPLLLLIEDNPELRQFLTQSLQTKYEILEAENGVVGIQIAKDKIPDIVISDVMMPLKDGFEVANTLKNEELTAHIPIILLTAKSAIESKLKGLKTGADAYLTKPFHTEELFIRIEKLIELRKKLQAKYANANLTKLSSIKTFPKKGQEVTPEPSKEVSELDKIFLEKLTTTIQANLDNEKLSVESLAQKLFISRSQLHRKAKALTGFSPNEFIRNYRLDYSLELLKNKNEKISQIAFQVGFSDEKYFSRRFKERFGVSPSEMRVS